MDGPEEIVLMILRKLDAVSLSRFGCCSKRFHRLSQDDSLDFIWKVECSHRFSLDLEELPRCHALMEGKSWKQFFSQRISWKSALSKSHGNWLTSAKWIFGMVSESEQMVKALKPVKRSQS